MKIAVVILAAGEGKRMKSATPKVLHPLAGRPMLAYVLDAARALQPERTITIIGHDFEPILKLVGNELDTVHQHEQLGTGHAVSLTKPLLGDFDGTIVVLSGDVPLLGVETLRRLIDTHIESRAAATILTAELADPHGYGRVLKDRQGEVQAIVEERDATPEQRRIGEVNAGTYCFDGRSLFSALEPVGRRNDQGEYYLTDVIGILKSQGAKIASAIGPAEEVLGINSRAELAEAERLIQDRLKTGLMLDGVTFINPESSFVAADVTIGRDTTVYPQCFLEAGTVIGSNCAIGPSARIASSTIGNDVTIQYAIIEGATIEDRASVGPFCRLRPGAVVGPEAKAGTFVEIKKSTVGRGSKVPHLSYIGDARIGENVNVGAGSITCNFDGIEKHETVIEDGAFLGSDTMLIAPVTVGKDAATAAGSAISRDVPSGALGIERTEQKNVPGWREKRKARKSKRI